MSCADRNTGTNTGANREANTDKYLGVFIKWPRQQLPHHTSRCKTGDTHNLGRSDFRSSPKSNFRPQVLKKKKHMRSATIFPQEWLQKTSSDSQVKPVEEGQLNRNSELGVEKIIPICFIPVTKQSYFH